jgi:hypothetical protein
VTHQDGASMSVQDVIDPEIDFNFRTSFIKLSDDEFIDDIRNIK